MIMILFSAFFSRNWTIHYPYPRIEPKDYESTKDRDTNTTMLVLCLHIGKQKTKN